MTLIVGLGLGFLIAVLVTGRGPAGPAGTADDAVQAAADTPQLEDADAPDDQVIADATSARGAVEGFVMAEVAGDLAESYSYLSAPVRETFRSASGWRSAHADVLPPITGFEFRETTSGASGTEVTGILRMEPGLDEVVGLVPASADVTWVAVQDAQGRWGIDLEASAIEPRYPDDRGARDAAADWARARQRCERSGQYGEGLVGATGPAQRLCGADGTVEVSAPQPLGEFDAEPFQAAFGDDAATWARIVDVTAPVPQRVVLAPVGDEWLVIGVLAPS